MVWNASTPSDTDLFVTAATTSFHEAKEMVRERMVASNGVIDAHYSFASPDMGKHRPSQVGWVKWHTNYAAIQAYCVPLSAFEATLHFDLAGSKLYTVRNEALVGLTASAHTELEVSNAGTDHPQYIEKVKVDSGSGDVVAYSESGIEINASSLTVTDTTNLVLASHTAEGFETAHAVVPSVSDLADNSVHIDPFALLLQEEAFASTPTEDYTFDIANFDYAGADFIGSMFISPIQYPAYPKRASHYAYKGVS